MGKSKKHKRRRSSSSSNESVGRADPKDLIHRLRKLEKCIKKGRYRSRSRSYSRRRSVTVNRSRSPSVYRRPRAVASAVERAVEKQSTGRDRVCSRSRSRSHSPRSMSVLPADTANIEYSPLPVTVEDELINACSVNNEPSEVLIINNDEVLPEDVIKILGDDPGKAKANDFVLHDALAVRWRHTITNGLSKEELAGLLDKYKQPTNLLELTPPKLNPEILTILNKQNSLRDGSYVEIQNQLGKGLSALGKGINKMLNNADCSSKTRSEMLEYLYDSSKIFTNLFHRVSVIRKNLITPLLNNNIREQVGKSPPSDFLFGSDLAEKIKLAKTLESASKDLKISKPAYNMTRIPLTNRTSSQQKSSVQGTSRNLNYYRPAYRTGEGRPSKGQSERRARWESRKENFNRKERKQKKE